MVCSPFIVTHGEDPDGVISHALLWQLCEQGYKEEPAGQFFLRYDTIRGMLPEIAGFAEQGHPCNTFVADLNFNPADMRTERGDLLDILCNATTFLHWTDHHDGTQLNTRMLRRKGVLVDYNANQCVAMQIAKRHGFLRDQDPYFRRLAQIAQAHDYAIT